MVDLAGRDLAWLERRRAELFAAFSQVGDFRRGALNVVWRKCGKSNCACAQPGHRGHGPQYNLTRRIAGKTVNTHLKPGPELDKARREVAEHQRFADLVEEVSQVSEAISSPVTQAAGTPAAIARSSIALASAGLVANVVSAGTFARSRRTGSPVHALGRYSARSMKACPPAPAWVK